MAQYSKTLQRITLTQELAELFHSDFIELWFWFLQQNRDYRKYIAARKNNNVAAIRKLEKQFPLVSDVYDDFGDTRRIQFDNWFKTRKHLFIEADKPIVQILNSKEDFEDGNLYIKLPMSIPVKRATQDVVAIVRAAYKDAKEVDELPIPKPKYPLAIKTKAWRDWLSLIKIQMVWELFEQGESPTEVVYKMIEEMEEASDFMEVDAIWSKDSLATKGNLQDLRVQVHQFRAQGKNIIDNTIDGVFPRKVKRK